MKQANAGRKREAEEPLLDMPTLRLVAEKDEDFASLRKIIHPIAGTPVNELSEELRGVLRKKAGDDLELILVSFFAACDTRARETERKRTHVTAGEESPRKQRHECLFFVSLLLGAHALAGRRFCFEAYVFVGELCQLDFELLVSPLEVLPFEVDKDDPPFCAEEGWLDARVVELTRWLNAVEGNSNRVPPAAFIRCSRGGKTRTLLELNKMLRAKYPQVAVVYISFNNFSSLASWEHRDPLGALCRRIAFAALKQRDATRAGFKVFRPTSVRESDIISWLGATPCMLLIDELNVGLDGVEASDVAPLVQFLKDNFLFTQGRYFAFSSHVVPGGRGLADFMDSVSERGIVIHQLPLIPSMEDARRKFQWPDLTVRQALFRGRVPALISYTRGSVPPSFDKRNAAIEEVSHGWNDGNVKELLSSFLSGEASRVPEPLLQLMSVAPIGGQGKLVWIPYHMVHVLENIASSEVVDVALRAVVTVLKDMFGGFETGKTSGGDSWEALFAIALVFRLVTRSFHSLLKLDEALIPNATCGLSYNRFWEQRGQLAFPDILTLDQLIGGLVDPMAYPHVAVYYPPHARFEAYDLIVVLHQAQGRRIVYGYQLKEGRAIPKNMSSEACQHSYVIRGDASQQETLLRGWHVASDDEIESFLGVTGSCLAPKRWRSRAVQ